MKNRIIDVQNVKITISKEELDDYICITDIAKAKSNSARAADVVRNWLRNRGTLEYLSVWEQIYNPEFKVFESEHFKKHAGKELSQVQKEYLVDVIMTWIEKELSYYDSQM